MQQLSFLPGEMTPGERSLIQRALKTLDRHLHEPGVAFTSTRAAREWLPCIVGDGRNDAGEPALMQSVPEGVIQAPESPDAPESSVCAD